MLVLSDVTGFNAIVIDKNSDTPVYRQLVGQINCIIKLEQLSPGVVLPTIRDLAANLGINPNTVVRAYEELRSAGIISKRRGSGCVVAAPREGKNSSVAKEVLSSKIDDLIASAGALGVGAAEVIQMIESKTSTVPARLPISKRSTSKPLVVSRAASPQPAVPSIWQPDEDGFID